MRASPANRLLARVWCRGIDGASRHGLPLLRLSHPHEGLFVRGRLDVRRTTALIGEGRGTIASSTADRSLNHPVSRAIVCADHALATRLTGTAEWRTERVHQAMPHMRAAVGSRPKLPTLHELERVRYTPITLPFKRAALLSHRIASRLGYGASSEHGQDEGTAGRRRRALGAIRSQLCAPSSSFGLASRAWHPRRPARLLSPQHRRRARNGSPQARCHRLSRRHGHSRHRREVQAVYRHARATHGR